MSMPEFEPTAEQREIVSDLAAGGRTIEQIARAVINPRTGKPIGERTLKRVFRKELERYTDLQALVVRRYREAVDRGEAWAVKLGMEHLIGIKNEEPKSPTATQKNKGLQISFVRSRLSDTGIDSPRDFDLPLSDCRDEPPAPRALPAAREPEFDGPMEMDPVMPRRGGWMR